MFINIPELRKMLNKEMADLSTDAVHTLLVAFLRSRQLYAKGEIELVKLRERYFDEEEICSRIYRSFFAIRRPRYLRDLNSATITIFRKSVAAMHKGIASADLESNR